MIDWHTRFIQQAAWTRPLRDYIFERCGLDKASRLLEVGCGTGAILADLKERSLLVHGIDLDPLRLAQAQRVVPAVRLLRGDALALPYADGAFDVVFCHFLLLWVRDPLQALQEMRRVTRSGGYVMALAEPDYLHRVDRPLSLVAAGRLQTAYLRHQGADPGLGQRLSALFRQAGIEIIETGQLQAAGAASSDGQPEWDVLEADLAGMASPALLEEWRSIDQRARAQGRRVLHVPTYFAFGRSGTSR